MRLVILEDNADRRQAMEVAISDRFGEIDVEFFVAVPPLIERLETTGLYDVALISLDHDLDMLTNPDGTIQDPGTGVDAANWLARQPAVAPVIVHTTNTSAGDQMVDRLLQAGWSCGRVTPYSGEDWIHEQWISLVRKLIVAHQPSGGMAALGLRILRSQQGSAGSIERVISECVRAARYRITGSSMSDEIAIQLFYLGLNDRLKPLIPENGFLDELGCGIGMLDEEFGAMTAITPTLIEDTSLDPTMKDSLRAARIRELQIDIIRVDDGQQPMQALMLSASRSTRTPLDSHRAQSTLADLRCVLEVALLFEHWPHLPAKGNPRTTGAGHRPQPRH